MKAVVYDAARSYAVTEVPTPQAGPGEIRIKVDQVGVCGTDLHIHDGDFYTEFPLIPGHELVGVVDQVGDGVTRFALGEQVTVNPNVNCGHCDHCLAGRLILCANLQGYGTNFPGFFAEYVTVHGVTRAEERVSFSPFDVFRREITIKGSFAEITSFAAAIAARRGGRARTGGIITHRFSLDDYPPAPAAQQSDPSVHLVVIVP